MSPAFETRGDTGTSDCVIIQQMNKNIYEKTLFKKGGADDKVISLLHYMDIVEYKKDFSFLCRI
jgi:hypothetical protein